MPCTEAYKEHIEYTFNAFCRVVIHYAAISAWRDRDKRRQREISLNISQKKSFIHFVRQTHISQTLTSNTLLRYAVRGLSSQMEILPKPCPLCQRKRGKSFTFIFSGVTHSRKSGNCTDAAGVRRGITYTVPCKCCMKKWRCCPMSSLLLPYDTIIKAHEGDPIAIQAVLDRYAGYIRYFSKMNGYYNSDMEDYIRTKLIESLFKFRLDR